MRARSYLDVARENKAVKDGSGDDEREDVREAPILLVLVWSAAASEPDSESGHVEECQLDTLLITCRLSFRLADS